MSDELRPPPDPRHDAGDSLEIFIDDGPDGEPIVDTVLRDTSGVGDAVRRTRELSEGS